jgi:hypothetical protein
VDYQIDQQVNFTFQSNILEKDIWSLTGSQAVIDRYPLDVNYGYYTLGLLKNGIEEAVKDGKTIAVYTIDHTDFHTAWDEQTAATQTALQNIYNLVSRGVNQYQVNQIVLRKTSLIYDNYMNNYTIDSAVLNRYFTWAGLKTYFNSLDTNAMNTIIDTQASALGGYWLYAVLQMDSQADGKILVNQEWWLVDKYETTIYGAVVA